MVFETNVKRKRRKVITRTSQAGEVLGVVHQADLQGETALGAVSGVLYWVVRQLGLERHQGGECQVRVQQRSDLPRGRVTSHHQTQFKCSNL